MIAVRCFYLDALQCNLLQFTLISVKQYLITHRQFICRQVIAFRNEKARFYAVFFCVILSLTLAKGQEL